ncbi:E3 ubiquitin-protein ligase TRIM21-like [Lampetra fluviatilis]
MALSAAGGVGSSGGEREGSRDERDLTENVKDRIKESFVLERRLLDEEEQEALRGVQEKSRQELSRIQNKIEEHVKKIETLIEDIGYLEKVMALQDPIAFIEVDRCRRHYAQKPELNKNVLIAGLVEKFKGSQRSQCTDHKEPMRYYCQKHARLVCATCMLLGGHKGCNAITVEEQQKKTKAACGAAGNGPPTSEPEPSLREVIQASDAVPPSLSVGPSNYNPDAANSPGVSSGWAPSVSFPGPHCPGREKGIAPGIAQGPDLTENVKGRIVESFALERQLLDEEEQEALRGVQEKSRQELSRIQNKIEAHVKNIETLTEYIGNLEKMMALQDPIDFLKDDQTLPSRARFFAVSLPVPERDGCSPTLNAASSHPHLQISEDRRTVKQIRSSQTSPNESRSQVLGSESFSSGRRYWEVDVSNCGRCCVGVAYETMPHNGFGNESWLGQNYMSWCLEKDGNTIKVMHGGVELFKREKSLGFDKVGIFLDWEARLLSFYRHGTTELLHSFHHHFTQPLVPAVGLLCSEYDNNYLSIVELN